MKDLSKLIPGVTSVDLTPMKGGVIKLATTSNYNRPLVKRAIHSLLRGFGVDLRDTNFTDTPERCAKMWAEFLQPRELKIAVFPSESQGAVTLTNHEAISVCPHHLLPFTMRVDLGYIPQGYVLGLSKLGRLIDLACGSFALQEHIPDFVVQVLAALTLPKGVMCRVRANHGCMRLRGLRTNGWVATTSLVGVYLTDEKARMEFMKEVENGEPPKI